MTFTYREGELSVGIWGPMNVFAGHSRFPDLVGRG